MADFSALIQRIKDAVYENGVQAITGQILQDCLKDVVNTVNVAKQDGIYRVTVTVDNNTGVPSATARMDDDTYTLEFSFHNLKGQKGDKGDKGDTPVLTADSDGVIYSDGVMLTRVIKDTTDALTTRADSDHARAESDHARAASDHTQAASDHTASETATQAATDAAEQATEAAETIDAKIAGKADKDGYYPEMSVGSLVGTEVTQVEGITTIAKSTGVAKINEVMGKSLVWNQLCSTSFPKSRYQFNNTEGSSRQFRTAGIVVNNIVAGHKYLFCTDFTIEENNSVTHNLTYLYSYQTANGQLITNDLLKKAAGRYKRTFIPVAGDTTATQQYFWSIDVGDYLDVTVNSVIAIDLTLMFGAGNEPTTVEEFEAMFPLDYYDYNEGEIINNKTEALEIEDTGGDVQSTLQLDISTITGKLNGEGESVTIFPDGMKSAGTAFDSLIVNEDGWCRRAVVRMKSVDMGDLVYTTGTFKGFVRASAALPIPGKSNNYMLANSINSYGFRNNNSPIGDNNVNLAMAYYGGRLYIRNDVWEGMTGNEIKASMSGVELVYELATPLEYVLDTPIQMTFQAKHGGVIRQLPENGSEPTTAPMRMSVTYALPPEALISGASLENLLNALKTANKISNYTMTYNPTSGKWEFTIS